MPPAPDPCAQVCPHLVLNLVFCAHWCASGTSLKWTNSRFVNARPQVSLVLVLPTWSHHTATTWAKPQVCLVLTLCGAAHMVTREGPSISTTGQSMTVGFCSVLYRLAHKIGSRLKAPHAPGLRQKAARSWSFFEYCLITVLGMWASAIACHTHHVKATASKTHAQTPCHRCTSSCTTDIAPG
jgi:hypothetical protein